MYSLRTPPYRAILFDKVCTTFVKNNYKYVENATLSPIEPMAVNLSTILIDYLDYAIETSDDNTALQDKVLDKLIISIK
jgi:hypothetical protein